MAAQVLCRYRAKDFDLKIEPIASYRLKLVWPHFTLSQLDKLNRVKPAFPKCVLGLQESYQNRLVYLLDGTRLFVEDCKRRLSVKADVYLQLIDVHEQKLCTIDPFFTLAHYSWKGANKPNQHPIVRYAAQGFHQYMIGAALT